MALMFPRLEQNFAKNGYYPTDEKTVECILAHLSPLEDNTHTQIFDPCAGEGVALAEVKHRLGEAQAYAYGVEYDKERAYHAKSILDTCVHGDMQDCIIRRNQFGLLFLNPPYGDLVSDHAQLSDRKHQGRQRLEKLFYQHTFQSLVFGGVMILIIPDYTLDKEYASWIAKHFTDVSMYRAVDQSFKQLVLFGVRRRTQDVTSFTASRDRLLDWEDTDVIDAPDTPMYGVSPVKTDSPMVYTRMDDVQLDRELAALGDNRGMWGDFKTVFANRGQTDRRPLTNLSDWHLALALAAGQVTGFVESDDGGSSLMIKGATHKEKEVKTVVDEQANGYVSETRIHTDKFISVIKAIDTTRGPSFGNIVTIR